MSKTLVKPKTYSAAGAKDIASASRDFCGALGAFAGISAKEYAKGPLGKLIFAASSFNPRELRFWLGESEADIVAADKGLRQVVVTIREPARTITRKTVVVPNHWKPGNHREWLSPEDAVSPQGMTTNNQNYLRARFGIIVPDQASFSATFIERWQEETSPDTSLERWRTKESWEITAKIKASTMHLLMGVDESANFIAELPKAVSSVDEAHEALRPAGISKKALRQGEWFFEPCSDKELLSVINSSPEHFTSKYFKKNSPLEPGSSHVATEALAFTAKGKRIYYVKGMIKDLRKGHHSPLELDRWHKVIRNTEVIRQTGDFRARNYWD